MTSGLVLNRLWAISTGVAGLLTAVAPGTASDLLCGPGRPPEAVVRVLGVREAGQGLVLLLRPDRRTAQLFTAVDIIHAVTMVAAIKLFPKYRQSEIVSAAAAIASAVLGFATVRKLAR